MKTYIIAEIGINHNGSLDNALKLIDVTAETGCAAAKFQFFTARNLYPKSAGKLDWRDKENKEYSYDIYQAVKGFETPPDWVPILMEHCKDRGIDFLSSVFDPEGLAYLLDLGMGKIKLSSYTITNFPLIEACAATGLPIIMSTGGATLGEVEEAVNLVRGHHDHLALLHCAIKYPTRLEDCNMGVLDTFKYAFPKLQRGFSDHTEEIAEAAVQSVYLGGTVLEKHVTLDRQMAGPDHFFALEPSQLKELVAAVKKAEGQYTCQNYKIDKQIYGSSEKRVYEHEQYLRDFAFMTIFVKSPIAKGSPINPTDLTILRSGKKRPGLHPRYLALFQNNKITANKDLAAETPLDWSAFL